MSTVGAPVRTQAEFEHVWGRPLLSRESFVAALTGALARRCGYATGKIGVTERVWLAYPIFLARETDPRRIRAYELSMAFRGLRTSGIFPPDAWFYRRWAELYVDCVRDLDCVGLFSDALSQELEILRFHRIEVDVMRFEDQEPDRSSPSQESRCWLPQLAGRDVLIVSPFAELLRERATRETFDAVWAKTGKRWFEPRSVAAVELPYGFAASTRARYPTAVDLLEEVTARIADRQFDVALIGAGGLGIPIASWVGRRGKVGISLGGHLQVLFGVLGDRWRARATWRSRYFNEAWIDMPERYRPDPRETIEDYW